jgi:hypothetical protein
MLSGNAAANPAKVTKAYLTILVKNWAVLEMEKGIKY